MIYCNKSKNWRATEGVTSISYNHNGDEYATTYTLSASQNEALELLSQIIEKAELDDLEHKKSALAKGQGEKAIGEDWMCFHLKKLKELIEDK